MPIKYNNQTLQLLSWRKDRYREEQGCKKIEKQALMIEPHYHAQQRDKMLARRTRAARWQARTDHPRRFRKNLCVARHAHRQSFEAGHHQARRDARRVSGSAVRGTQGTRQHNRAERARGHVCAHLRCGLQHSAMISSVWLRRTLAL